MFVLEHVCQHTFQHAPVHVHVLRHILAHVHVLEQYVLVDMNLYKHLYMAYT